MRLEYFEMIDRVAELDTAGRLIKCESKVPQQSTVFEGHFPGHPLVPGVLLIETMAQASGYLALVLNNFGKMAFLASVKEAKLRSFMLPGASIEIRASVVHEGSGYIVTKAEILHEGKRVSDAELMLRILPFPSPEFSAMMRQQAERLGIEANP